MQTKNDVLSGNVLSTFLKYAIPNVIGMVALSSAVMIDGIFLGNYVGSKALAAVNLILPLWSFLFGIVLMFSVGGNVRCGKYLGERKGRTASRVFTQTITAVIFISITVLLLGQLFIDKLPFILGAGDLLVRPVEAYLYIFFIFLPFQLCGFCLSGFVQLEGRPGFAALGLIVAAVLNIGLDWLLIGHMNMGIEGAAVATGISQLIMFLMMLSHFLSKRSILKLNWTKNGWTDVFKSAYNGLSEFLNEVSAGIVTLIFNWVMIRRMGIEGVAAFTIINYLLFIGLMFSYGISEALQPTVSQNFGARSSKRITSFLGVAGGLVTVIGIGIIGLLFLLPDEAISLFLKEGEQKTVQIATTFISFFWPAFLFNGANIVLSSYFTAMHKPTLSAVISVARSLILPVGFLAILPLYLGDIGIFVAIPLAEASTFLIALVLLAFNRPKQLVKIEYAAV